jgi:hypothetical protein
MLVVKKCLISYIITSRDNDLEDLPLNGLLCQSEGFFVCMLAWGEMVGDRRRRHRESESGGGFLLCLRRRRKMIFNSA